MNWGHKITLVFLGFVIMMVYMVVKSFQANVDLVSEDYYLEELNYQQQIDKKNNVEAANMAIKYQITPEGVFLTFPDQTYLEKVSGSINLYRPSAASMDVQLSIALDSQFRQLIRPDQFSPGKYILKIDWTDGGKPYYQEIDLLIPGV